MYQKQTHAIDISVDPHYLDDQSTPAAHYYVWSYTVTIRNLGTAAVKLLRRQWKVIDAKGSIKEVDGEGVVGVQPKISSGEMFEYTSGTHLNTSNGMMVGTYEFCYIDLQGKEGHPFIADIPAFSLDMPGCKKQIH